MKPSVQGALRAASWSATIVYLLAAVACVVGNSFRHDQWLYVVSFTLAGFAALLFVATVTVLSVQASGRPLRRKRLRELTSLWWQNAPSGDKGLVAVMIAIGILVTTIGILGTAQHADLVARNGAYFVVTDAGVKSVGKAAYDGLMYSQYVLGTLGPAMAISGFVLMWFHAFSFAGRRPDLRAINEAR